MRGNSREPPEDGADVKNGLDECLTDRCFHQPFDSRKCLNCGTHGFSRGAKTTHRKHGVVGKFLRLGLSHVYKGPNDPQVALIHRVVGFHRAQRPIVQRRHQERLSAVVEVVGHRDDVVLLGSCNAVEHTALHARAKGANRDAVVVFSHRRRRVAQDVLALVKVWHPEMGQVWYELRWHG
eukprot:scaffold1143_cov25-Tisochrysis_lutea.AAC.3